MSQSKVQAKKEKILELIDKVIDHENLREGNRAFDMLNWVKFHVKDLATECKGCAESNSDTGGGESKS